MKPGQRSMAASSSPAGNQATANSASAMPGTLDGSSRRAHAFIRHPLSKEAAMSESTTHAELVRPAAPLFDDARLAVGAFLARYGAPTRTAYSCDLRAWFGWCDTRGLRAFEVCRP